MTTEDAPSASPGQLSPDGLWRWDGAQWVPTTSAQGRPPIASRSRAWIWWAAGGCVVLVAIVVMAAIIGGAALVNRMQNGSLTCLPSDFPKYPGATVTGETNYLGTVSAPGDTHECRMTFESNDDVSTVTGFYAAQMDVGEWMITANDTGNGVMQVRLRSRPATVGQIQFAGLGRHTQIQVKLDS